jgi:hypothetical protein
MKILFGLALVLLFLNVSCERFYALGVSNNSADTVVITLSYYYTVVTVQ